MSFVSISWTWRTLKRDSRRLTRRIWKSARLKRIVVWWTQKGTGVTRGGDAISLMKTIYSRRLQTSINRKPPQSQWCHGFVLGIPGSGDFFRNGGASFWLIVGLIIKNIIKFSKEEVVAPSNHHTQQSANKQQSTGKHHNHNAMPRLGWATFLEMDEPEEGSNFW